MSKKSPTSKKSVAPALFDAAILRAAARDAVLKLNPRALMRNPVIFVTEIVSILVTILGVRDFVTRDLFSEILKGEEEHVDFLETQLELIGKIGRENYIQLQAEPPR